MRRTIKLLALLPLVLMSQWIRILVLTQLPTKFHPTNQDQDA